VTGLGSYLSGTSVREALLQAFQYSSLTDSKLGVNNSIAGTHPDYFDNDELVIVFRRYYDVLMEFLDIVIQVIT
jgi:hypothetical protein